MQVKAVARYVRISPQKVRLMADAVKGKPVEKALATVRFMPQKAAGIVEKVLRSAVANADQLPDVDVDDLGGGQSDRRQRSDVQAVPGQGPRTRYAHFETHQSCDGHPDRSGVVTRRR
jgi:hypothetical protein